MKSHTTQKFPSDFLTLKYTPQVLLDVHFPSVLVADLEYGEACQVGFDSYFDEMVTGSSLQDARFADRFYTFAEVKQEVMRWTVEECERFGGSVSWCAGFVLGWLSALALVQPREAVQGLDLLGLLVKQLLIQCKQKGGGL